MYGVVKGVYYCNNYRLDEINKKIAQRNLPSQPLQTQFDPRPVETRFILKPGIDYRKETHMPILNRGSYNMKNQFNPGTSNPPFSGYANNVDTESNLRDIFMSNQKWCAQNDYIPSSKSDLYNSQYFNEVINNDNIQNIHQINKNDKIRDHSLLFNNEMEFNRFNPNPCNLGFNLFNNHTRQQLKDIDTSMK